MLTDKYIDYISGIRRYAERTREIYADVLKDFKSYQCGEGNEMTDDELIATLDTVHIRNYEVYLLEKRKESARTVNLHISVLSGFCRFLVKEKVLISNPVKLVGRPKMEKRLPVFYREESMDEYFAQTAQWVSEGEMQVLESYDGKPDKKAFEIYDHILARTIVSVLYGTGIRRSELIGLRIGSVDFSRNVIIVLGKGDKMREIPLVSSLSKDISLYLQATESVMGSARSLSDPLLVTAKGSKLYPVYVDRVIKGELGQIEGITGRKSPHVLRHTLATELLNNGADLNSIKELLGHSSLAATQVYTHNSIEKLKNVYNKAHPRAKNGGKNGD